MKFSLKDAPSFLQHTLSSNDSDFPQSFNLGTSEYRLPARGVLEIDPGKGLKKEVVISCGIHGNETAPIEIVNNLVSDILAGQQAVNCRTMFTIGHPEAIQGGKRFVDINLNRLFFHEEHHEEHQHHYDHGIELKRAEVLTRCLEEFFISPWPRFHYDLHTAIRDSVYRKFAVYPWRSAGDWDPIQMSFLADGGIEAVLLSHTQASTFSSHSACRFGATAFTLELGKVMPFGENPMQEFTAIGAQLRHLFEYPDLPAPSGQQPRLYQVVKELIRPKGEAVVLKVEDSVANFTAFPPNTLILEGGGADYRTSKEGEAIVFPNREVPAGQRMGLMVVPANF
jgi:succinylglutamate desuccinylase